jgi:hypothetical protein
LAPTPARSLALSSALPAAAKPAASGVVGAAKPNRRVRRETRLPFYHHTIAVANAAGDNRQPARRPLDDNSSLPCGIGPIDDVHVGSALPGDDRLCRHDERAVLIKQMQ